MRVRALLKHKQENPMKKLIALLLLTLGASTAMAQHHGYGHGKGHGNGYRNLHGHHGHYARGHVGGGWGWAVPAAIGGLIVYQATRPQSVIVQPPPVVYQQAPVVIQQPSDYSNLQNQNCTAWTEVQSSDGSITRTRTCTQ
jgi:hypothetical protein